MVAKRIASRLLSTSSQILPGLDDRRVQIEVVRHHRGAEDADRDVEHVAVGEDAGGRDHAARDLAEHRARQPELDGERPGDEDDERDDERFDVAEAAVLQVEDDEHVERRQADAPDERQAEQQVERDGGAEHLGEVAGGDGDFAEDPQADGGLARVVVAAGLGEVAAAGDAEARGERLQQDRHQVRDHDDAEQRVAEARAAGEVGGPVARVHVADRDEVARAGKGEHLFPESGAVRNGDRAVDFGQADLARRQPPAADRRRRWIFATRIHYFDYSKT